jgi:uncharacterized phage infection (PIP) family protein YhgE
VTTLPTRLEIEKTLSQAFTPEQTSRLVEVFDTIRQVELERAADTRDLKRGLAELTEEVKKLASAQQRTDERLGKFQQRTDERFAELATAQQHTDDSVAQLSRAVQTLAETVNRGLGELRQAVGSLANTFGFDLEEFVAALLPPYLDKHAGITTLTLERRYFEMNGEQPVEVDLVGEGQRAGRPVTVLAECRTTIGGGEMRRLAEKLDAIAASMASREVVKIVVSMNLHPTGEQAAQETGIWAIPYSRINRDRG